MSDLMAGLLMVFILIAVAYMRNAYIDRKEAQKQKEIAIEQQQIAQRQRDKMRRIAVSYQQNKKAIYQALLTEFKGDLQRWNAAIDKDDLTFNFKSPEVLFAVGSARLRPKFEDILSDFFPRYMQVIEQFTSSVNEIRIEGHTSSRWSSNVSETTAYFNNMQLSQNRTRSVLNYVYRLPPVISQQEWIKKHVAAVGYSSAKLIVEDGIENAERSRRVAFRVITNSEQQIVNILAE